MKRTVWRRRGLGKRQRRAERKGQQESAVLSPRREAAREVTQNCHRGGEESRATTDAQHSCANHGAECNRATKLTQQIRPMRRRRNSDRLLYVLVEDRRVTKKKTPPWRQLTASNAVMTVRFLGRRIHKRLPVTVCAGPNGHGRPRRAGRDTSDHDFTRWAGAAKRPT